MSKNPKVSFRRIKNNGNFVLRVDVAAVWRIIEKAHVDELDLDIVFIDGNNRECRFQPHQVDFRSYGKFGFWITKTEPIRLDGQENSQRKIVLP